MIIFLSVIVSRMDTYTEKFLAHFSAQHKIDFNIAGLDALDEMNHQKITVIDAASIGEDTAKRLQKV